MSSTPPSGGRLLVEPLEARIAPTGLVGLANNPASASDPNYLAYATKPTAGHLGFVPASTYLGNGAAANLYAIQLTGDGSVGTNGLSNGDKLLIYNSTTGFNPTTPFLQATNKSVVAFFQDANNDGQVQLNELVGLSLTKKSGANVNGNVNGDIVSNLSKDGATINATSVGSSGFQVSGLNVNGDVNGNILVGGNLNNSVVRGNVAGDVRVGTATDGFAYNFTGNAGAVSGTISNASFPDFKAGASINNLTVASLTPGHTIHAGGGGFAAVGGNVAGLSVLTDTSTFNVVAGDGGGGNVVFKGATGGSVSNTAILGVAGGTGVITIQGGNGGVDNDLKGGTGGSVISLSTSFDTSGGTTLSADLLTQNILVHAGDGGAGLKGGKGGDVLNSNVYSSAPDDGVVTNGVANAEIQILGGHGGLGAFKGGKGGNILQVSAQDLDANADGVSSLILVQAGDGGVGNGAAGKDGGSIGNLTLLSGNLMVNAGSGGDGATNGGLGGTIDTVNILNLPNRLPHQVTLNAGSGGLGNNGAGGQGGDVKNVTMQDSDLSLLAVNTGTHGNGGQGNNGVGGLGGSVTNLQFTDSDAGGQFAPVSVRAGLGGDGLTGGGAGGGINQVQMFGSNFSYAVAAGAGGTVLPGGGGAGGNGGNVNTVGFSSVQAATQIEVGQALTATLAANYTAQTGSATAGAGGGGSTTGGDGGSMVGVNLRASYDVTLTAGAGGAGGDSKGGDGGLVGNSAGVSLGGSVAVVAGNAAGSGSFAANGGSITSFIAAAQNNITMTAGNGGVGGVGGSIATSGTAANPLYYVPSADSFGNPVNLTTSNFGNVTITAGAGSSANGVGGAGGSITNFSGSVGLGGNGSETDFTTVHVTALRAGAGGGGNGQTASGAGGGLSQIQLTGNSATLDTTQYVTLDAGSAGQAGAAKKGASGGSVNNAVVFDLDAGTVVQHVAAGDGGNGFKKGGDGGTVSVVNVGRPGDTAADIGLRSNAAYGYSVGTAANNYADAGAGGVFAGVGGTGSKLTGANGSVTNVTASAIASIVAGKGAMPQLATLVDKVYLEGTVQAVADASGAFTNFAVANVAGSVVDPTQAGASTYHQGDGLVAALTLGNNVDFAPEAFLTLVNNQLVLADIQEPNPTPVVSPAPSNL